MRNIAFCLIMLLGLACTNNTSDQSNSKTNNHNSSNSPGKDGGRSPEEQLNNETNVDDDAITFIKQAGSANVFEIELARLAQQRAGSSRVKNFSNMIVKDHSKSNQELKALAANKNVLLTYSLSADQKRQIQEMQKMSGQNFDKRYMQIMVSGHEKDIEIFKSGSDNRDNAVNSFANKTLPVLNMHIDSAKAIRASLK